MAGNAFPVSASTLSAPHFDYLAMTPIIFVLPPKMNQRALYGGTDLLTPVPLPYRKCLLPQRV